MQNVDKLFDVRQSLDKICKVPEKIISVYALEQHIWVDTDETPNQVARASRLPARQTIEEFQINPVRSFLNDILRLMAAPYRPERRDNPIGQGYWIQAEFGSGKSHLLCFLAALALGKQEIWDVVREKEEKAGRGKRESLYQFWEEGIAAKNSRGQKGIFVIVKTLVGSGGGTVGMAGDTQRLVNYILDAAREQLLLELGKNVSLYPTELLADRFLQEDYARYRDDLKRFLRDPRFFEEDEFEDVDEFIEELQANRAPEYKRSCGEKLWRFYDEYLKMRPHLETETEDVLKHMVEAIMAEGYSGVLLILDEVSLFMKNRGDEQRVDDEQTLVVLSNRLAKVHNLPIWTVCAAQQAIESKMGVKNIIANDRLKQVPLLNENDNGYYDIVLARVREIIDPEAINNYYLYYKRNFTWPATVGEDAFRHFFPFHKPALEVLRAITGELTTARSAIHFMHQTLHHQIKERGDLLISLWQLFDEAVNYEEDPSGVNAGIASIRTKREQEYKIYEACKRQIDGQTKGALKVYRDRAIKTLQTLFLYHVAHIRQQGITPEEIANAVLECKSDSATLQETIEHYEILAENLKRELRQIVESPDDDGKSRYRFDPVFSGIDPRREFQKARDEVESDEKARQDAWSFLLGLAQWPVKARQTVTDLANGTRSLFSPIAATSSPYEKSQPFEVIWQGREITGTIGMRDLLRMGNAPLPQIQSDETDHDFAIYVATAPVSPEYIEKLLQTRNDPRILIWTPAAFTTDERSRLADLAAYRKLVSEYSGKDSDDAVAIIQWVADALRSDIGSIAKVVESAYARGRIDGLATSNMEFHVAGDLISILTPVIERALAAVYESRDIRFEPPILFRKEDAVKVINGIVKTGEIPRHAKPTADISAATNFGYALGIMKKGPERKLEVANNPFVQDMLDLINDKQNLSITTFYKKFMGIGSPKSYGLSRRMVQIYLLCLAQMGKIRIELGPKAGQAVSHLDYLTMKEIPFSVRVLDAMGDVQKLEQPKNWETFRPFAEALLDETIPVTHDDTVIAPFRRKLDDLFENGKRETPRLQRRAETLFGQLQTTNPYEQELQQFATFFTDANAQDIDDVLYRLQRVFGYQVFDTGVAEQTDRDDLRLRVKHHSDLQQFLEDSEDLLLAYQYAMHPLPQGRNLERVHEMQQELARKLQNLQPYIDSDVKLRTELIGSETSQTSNTATLHALMAEYAAVYRPLHNNVLSELKAIQTSMQNLLNSSEFAAFKQLEKISALQPPVSVMLENTLSKRITSIFTCPNPSRASIDEQLKSGPVHTCELSFTNYEQHLQAARETSEEAHKLFNEEIERKMEIFLNLAIQERLKQGSADPAIAALLKCQSVGEVRAYLLDQCQINPGIVETINRHLKRIVVKTVRLADFHPSTNNLEREQIAVLAQEFRTFLEQQFASIDEQEGADMLPMLQIE